MITPAATGACRPDTVTKGKTVTLVQKSFCVSEKDRQYAEIVYPMVQDSIREANLSCRDVAARYVSKRYCGYWKYLVRGNTEAPSATTERPFSIRGDKFHAFSIFGPSAHEGKPLRAPPGATFGILKRFM